MSSRRTQPPPAIPGAEVIRLLGSGGFADVYLYQNQNPKRQVAVKVMRHGVGGTVQEAFEAEANLMAKLSDHPQIVSMYDVGMAADGRPYLVMEFCPPPNLGAKARKKPLSVDRALQTGISIAGAVETAHRAGVIHRDIKPANILVTSYGHPVLTDFGISVVADTQHQAASPASLPWAPPEQVLGTGPMGPGVDVYSLGATVYTLLVGYSPFQIPGDTDQYRLYQRVLNDPVKPTGRPDVPEQLERILAIAMAKKPENRYPSAVEFARALQQVQTDLMLAVTRIDIGGDVEDWISPVDPGEGEGTRIRGAVAIDPHGPGVGTTATGGTFTSPVTTGSGQGNMPTFGPGARTAPTQPAPASPDEMEQTVLRGGIARTEEPETYSSSTETSVRPQPPEPRPPLTKARIAAITVAAILALVVAGLGVYSFLLGNTLGGTNTGGPKMSETPVDVMDVAPSVEKLQGAVAGGQVTFTWVNPSPQEGDTYLYQLGNAETLADTKEVKVPRLVVPAKKGTMCLEVALRRSSGTAAESARKCLEVP